ncbi:hypothetical protein FA95DRAFT_1554640 [Auriscalpium vulgare]|uniref:Uncharacterized protein n=1 Tax=Auriscalpium vulgare TaxID=40419 RepID=A0ACB8S5Y1_9AGAM|nr:hypothetical protein FA95DRAFT_1554640 [Auriscalpium vulgare]
MGQSSSKPARQTTRWQPEMTEKRRTSPSAGQLLPRKVFQDIALFLPRTRDILALALVNRSAHSALAVVDVYKDRVRLHGWDTNAWEEEDRAGDVGDMLRRWKLIDWIHARTKQLFDMAADKRYFRRYRSAPSTRPSAPGRPAVLISVAQLSVWLNHVSIVLPSVLTHHRARNIPHLTDPAYHAVLRRALGGLVDLSQSRALVPTKERPSCVWLERASFSFATLILQCDRQTAISIYGGANIRPKLSLMDVFQRHWELPELTTPSPWDVARWHALCYVVQALEHLHVQLDPDQDDHALRPARPPPLPPALAYDWPFTAQNARRCPDATPLGALTPTGGEWAGYYYNAGPGGGMMCSPPMQIMLEALPRASADALVFSGVGMDSVGDFVLEGQSGLDDGRVQAKKFYTAQEKPWVWDGVLTSYGAVGRWGDARWGGWWVIWPKDWSTVEAVEKVEC